MNSYRLTARAEDDLLALFLDGIEKFGFAQAERYSVDLEQCFQLIATNPHMGRVATAIGLGVRRHEHQSHIILYEENESGVTILQSLPQEASVC